MRVLGYVRVSTSEQASSGLGLAAQREAIIAACEQRGLDLVRIVEDGGYSAKNLDRPGITAALLDLAEGRADGLVVAKLDRLSRSLLDFAALMDRARGQGWAIVALDLGVDTTTPSGEMLANVLASFAQFERRLIGQRTRDALAVKRGQGVKLGRPRTTLDHVVARVHRERSDGRSLAKIAQALTDDGVPTAQGGARWYASTVRAVLAYTEPAPCSGPVELDHQSGPVRRRP
jgi:DNA invertase Pin-like site-specific DNA recombinase